MIRTRREMAELLDDLMNRSYSALAESQQLDPDTSLLKSYLIEAHACKNPHDHNVSKLLERSFAQAPKQIRDSLTINPGSDRGLTVVETRFRGEQVSIFIDHTNPRYWLAHSMNTSNTIDPIVSRLVQESTELDSTWFPAGMLEFAAGLGDIRGMGLSYDRRLVPDADFSAEDAPVEMLKMQLWGRQAGDVLRILRSSETALPSATSLSKIKIKYSSATAPQAFTLDDIRFDGKVTARGTSFSQHIELISTVFRRYQKSISRIEERFSIGPSHRKDRFIDGEPITFAFRRPIANIEVFCEKVFAATRPFRLWGVPVRLSPGVHRVRAVDLHVGSPLHFEIFTDHIRLYLVAGTCGNSVLRFYTNLQHYYDAQVLVHDSTGGDLLGI